MSRRVPLHAIAHARAGDKGNDSNVSLWPYDARHYDTIARQLVPERIRRAWPDLVQGPVEVYPLPQQGGFNIVMRNALEGGVNGSLGLDGHGKSWSYLVLQLEIELGEDPA